MGRFSRVSPALVISCLALSVSLGGVGWAATVLPRNSVGTAQLKKNSVTTQKVKNASLLAADFKPGQLPTGPAGLQGPLGAQGDKGDKGERGEKGDAGIAGLSGYEIVVASQLSPGVINIVQANCPPGKKVLGGGSSGSSTLSDGPFVATSRPTTNQDGWVVITHRITSGGWTTFVYAICANVS